VADLSSDFRTWLLEPVLAELNAISDQLRQIVQKEITLMSALSDLQAAEAAIAAAVQNAITLIQQQQTGGVASADVEAVVSQLQAAAASLNVAVQPAPAP